MITSHGQQHTPVLSHTDTLSPMMSLLRVCMYGFRPAQLYLGIAVELNTADDLCANDAGRRRRARKNGAAADAAAATNPNAVPAAAAAVATAAAAAAAAAAAVTAAKAAMQ